MPIQLYTCKTANGYRASIMLEECELPYVAHAIDLASGAQHTPAFRRINPLGRVPAIVDEEESLQLSESLAITLYVAEKADRFVPRALAQRALANQWGATVVSGFSAAAAGIFFARQLDAGSHAKLIEKFFADIDAYLDTMERRLTESRYLAGDEVSYADLIMIPTIVRSLPAMKVDLSRFEAIARWSQEIGARAGVLRGLAVPE